MELYKRILNDVAYADLTIKLNKETPVQAHRCIVGIRCPEILPLPDFNDPKQRKKIKDKKTLTLKDKITADTMKRVLEYIYTGNVEFQGMEPKNILQLNKAAKHFSIKRLSWLCEDYMQNSLCMENIFEVLKCANEANEPYVKSCSMQFAIDNYNDFVKNKDGLHILGLDLFQEVVTAFQTFSATKQRANVSIGDEPENTIISDFKRLHKQMPYADAKFLIDGEEIMCHKAILSGCSEIWKGCCGNLTAAGFPLKGLSADAFKQMLRFIYYGDDNIEPLPACELVGFARNYGMNDLVTVCENKIRNSIEIDTVLGILEVAYAPDLANKQELVDELKSKTWPFIIEHYDKINLQPLLSMNPLIAQDMLLKVQEYQKSK